MFKNTIEVTLITSKKAGILPVLMREVSVLGLIYRRCNTKEYEDSYKLTLVCEGELVCGESKLIKSITELPGVVSVISVVESTSQTNNSVDNFKDTTSDVTELHPLRAKDPITHDVMHIAEDRLSEVFGPTTNILLKSAAKKSSRVGELFLHLAEEMTNEQKMVFLKNVKDLNSLKFSEM